MNSLWPWPGLAQVFPCLRLEEDTAILNPISTTFKYSSRPPHTCFSLHLSLCPPPSPIPVTSSNLLYLPHHWPNFSFLLPHLFMFSPDCISSNPLSLVNSRLHCLQTTPSYLPAFCPLSSLYIISRSSIAFSYCLSHPCSGLGVAIFPCPAPRTLGPDIANKLAAARESVPSYIPIHRTAKQTKNKQTKSGRWAVLLFTPVTAHLFGPGRWEGSDRNERKQRNQKEREGISADGWAWVDG